MAGNVEGALAAAVSESNEWLDAHYPGVKLHLVDQSNVKQVNGHFVTGMKRRKVSHWNWESLYYKEVRGRTAWMFQLRRGDQPLALCLGRIRIQAGYVAVEYLERRAYARKIRGAPVPVAFQFAAVVANVLRLGEVRLNNPLNARLARYYERTLGMTAVRRPGSREVQYLFKQVQA